MDLNSDDFFEKPMQLQGNNRSGKYGQFAKRSFDLCVTLVVLTLLLPLLFFLMACVRIKLGSPVFFLQSRIGLRGRIFRIIKFRTMSDKRDAHGNLLPDEQRLTGFGNFLRRNSLDELPELLNVVSGHMSLVGPRPLPVKYRERYSLIQWRRHEVVPGITGLAQISGRNAMTWEQKFRMDVWYVDNWSFWLDIKILIGTISHLIRREGISHEGHATMPEFFSQDHRE